MWTRKLVEHLTYRLIAVGLAAAIGALGCCQAWAKPLEKQTHEQESKVIHDSQVTAASFSTGKQGNRLKWLPYRPSETIDRNAAVEESEDRPSETQQAEAKAAESPREVEPRRVVVKRAMVSWADIDWSEAKDDGVHQVDFQDPPKPGLHAAEDPLKNPFGDTRRSQSPKARLARVRGPNLGGPFLQPVANAKDARPLPVLSPNNKAEPRMLLNQPSGTEGLADDKRSDRKMSTIEEELAQNPKAFMDKCPGRDAFKSIDQLNDNVTAKKGKFPPECPLAHEVYQSRCWTPTTFAWTAAGTCHKPLYFEQVQVERYGHSWGPIIQPLLSGAHFFVTVPILPYKMGMYPPGECMYSLGYYRPGSCAPFMLDPLPLSVRGGLVQAGAVVGVAAIVP